MRTLCKSQYFIDDTQKLPKILSSILPLQDDEEDVLYNVDSILTNIQETINSTIEQINVQKKSTSVCLKLILRRLLVKLATERTFKFSNRFFFKNGWFHYGWTTICYF